MNHLLVESVAKSHADRLLFSNVSFGINAGQKVALIARNGTGKTSLLNIIAGIDVPDEGTATRHPDIRIGYLNQNPELDESKTIRQVIFDTDAPITQAVSNYEEAMEMAEENPSPENKEKLQLAMQQMEVKRAWDYETKIRTILSKLKIRINQPVGHLSGGQKKRVALARILIQEPNFMILDEPTNHLDIEMIEWLEEYLSQPNLTLLLVTHDRYFLDRITNEILELEGGNIYKYKGNYQYYLEKKNERIEQQQTEVQKAQSLMRKELEWVRRMPKARGTKNKARLQSFENVSEKAKQKIVEQEVEFQIDTPRLGGKIVELHNINKNYNDLKILENFSYKFKRYEKVGIIGKNGVGKTTFLNILTEKEPYDSGTLKTGSTVQFGYYSQEGLQLKEDKRVIEIIRDIAEVVELTDGNKVTARQFLYHWHFDSEMQHTYFSRLSGGEKRKLHLLTVLMKNPNFLILDEPTNDLDLDTLQILEEFLDNYPGCVIVVTHDRYFMDRIVDHLFVFEGEGIVRDFPGTYSQFRDEVLSAEKRTREKRQAPPAPTKAESLKKDKKKLSYMEQREFEKLEEELRKLEERKVELTALLNSGEADHNKLIEWSDEIQRVIKELDKKGDRWLELAERA